MRQGLAALVIVAATFIAYAPAIRGGFVWDDDRYLTENRVIPAPDGLKRIWITTLFDKQTSQYYPLTYTTFWLEYRLYGGFEPAGFHIFNVLLHACNALLVGCVLKYLKIPGAWAAAAIFALHPVHVESTAWITERKNVLSAFFYLLAMLAFLRYEDRRQLRWYAAAFLSFCLAMLSKTAFCTLPAALILIRWFRRKPIAVGYVASLIPFFAVGIGLGLVTAWYEIRHVGAGAGEPALSFAQRILLAGRALWFYPAKLTWPSPIIFNYPRWDLDPADARQWFFPAGVGAVAMIVWRLRHRIGRGPAAALAFMAGTLVPALGFFDVFYFRYSFVADHFQYISSLGWIALITGVATWGLRRFVQREHPRRLLGSTLCGCLCLALGAKTSSVGRMYENKETLWRETIRQNPRGHLAYNNLGIELRQRGHLLEAEQHFRASLQRNPRYVPAMTNLGSAVLAQGKPAEAEPWFRKAIATNPAHPHVHYNLGSFLLNRKRYAEAAEAFRDEIRVNPVHAGAYASLGGALLHLGQNDEARRYLTTAIEKMPELAYAHYNLGWSLAFKKRYAEAIPHFQRAVALEPENPQFRRELQSARQSLEAQPRAK